MTVSKATFSPCRKYRYWLERVWNAKLPLIGFTMLNPSVADENTSDATVSRCQVRALKGGFGGLVVTNLFAWVSTDPSVLPTIADPVGPENDEHIVRAAKSVSLLVCGWGVNKTNGRDRQVLALLRANGTVPHALRITRAGHPEHPLYLSYDLVPMPMPRNHEGVEQ